MNKHFFIVNEHWYTSFRHQRKSNFSYANRHFYDFHDIKVEYYEFMSFGRIIEFCKFYCATIIFRMLNDNIVKDKLCIIITNFNMAVYKHNNIK